ncbi:MAG: hypothetical protein JST83_11265 [Bacteroidetes bacterium]|nr:hypothetical protein [Bacteroidota bacterium]
MLKKVIQSLSLGICYVILSLCIGECHPFSRVSMYDSFPQDAYTFYISDGQNAVLPLTRYSRMTTDGVTHFFNAWREYRKVSADTLMKNERLYAEAGQAIAREIRKHQYANHPLGDFRVHEIFFFAQGDTIKNEDKVMYESRGEE